jgi:hypothetical protein
MSDPTQGPYDYQYKRFFEAKDSHQGYEFQHAPGGSAQPPIVSFVQKLKWWSWDRWKRRRKILAERDRLQREILNVKKPPTRP